MAERTLLLRPQPTERWPQLRQWVEAMQIAGAPELREVPPNLALRLRQDLAQAASRGLVTLPRKLWRQLPYAWFVENEPPLEELYPEWVSRYWDVVLPHALRQGRHRIRRWLSPAFSVYCMEFNAQNPAFVRFAGRLDALLAAAELEGSAYQRWQQELAFFSPRQAPGRIAQWLVSEPERDRLRAPIQHLLQQQQLPESVLVRRLGQASFEEALKAPPERLRTEPALRNRLFAWADALAAQNLPVAKSPQRIAMAHAVLKPWVSVSPTGELRRELTRWLLQQYGDPRDARHRTAWVGIDEDARQLLLRWLAGDSLQGFLSVLRETADHTWPYREKFWMAYFDEELITEAWLVLGPQAEGQYLRLASQTKGRGGYASFARGSQVQAEQSALLLRMGNLLFAEWSHNGALRAFELNSPICPQLYQRIYDASALRRPSLDFHEGLNKEPQLSHKYSERSQWQDKARNFIAKHLSVRMPRDRYFPL